MTCLDNAELDASQHVRALNDSQPILRHVPVLAHTCDMRVLLKFTLDCTPDAAWRAITSPDVFREVSAPFMAFESLEAEGFAEQWTEGRHPLEARALDLVPIGEQTVDLEFLRKGDVRIVRDTGRGVSGPLTFVDRWEHSMAVSPTPEGRTLYRDQLVFSATPATAALWPMYWAFWQWRGSRIRSLSTEWTA